MHNWFLLPLIYLILYYVFSIIFFKKLEKTNITDGMNPSVFDNSIHRHIYRRIYSVGISNTHRQTESVGIWHNYRRIYRLIYTVSITNTHRQLYRRYVSVGKSRYHRRMKICRYISSGKLFFGAQIPSVKPSANGFFMFPTDIATKWGITDEGKADRCNPSMNC